MQFTFFAIFAIVASSALAAPGYVSVVSIPTLRRRQLTLFNAVSLWMSTTVAMRFPAPQEIALSLRSVVYLCLPWEKVAALLIRRNILGRSANP
jgi:hypothetical protein